jgi:hypothetical protein
LYRKYEYFLRKKYSKTPSAELYAGCKNALSWFFDHDEARFKKDNLMASKGCLFSYRYRKVSVVYS